MGEKFETLIVIYTEGVIRARAIVLFGVDSVVNILLTISNSCIAHENDWCRTWI